MVNIAQTLIRPLYTLAHIVVYAVEVNMFADTSWQEKYMQTIVEVNGQKMPERIAATRQAIAGRLQDLEHDTDHHTERTRLEAALRALSVLERRVQTW